MTNTDSYTDWERRQHDADGGILADVIAQLAQVHAFLETHQVPVSEYYPTVIGRVCTSTAEVDQIATQIGAVARWVAVDQYTAERAFGSNVAYQATYIVKASQLAELAA